MFKASLYILYLPLSYCVSLNMVSIIRHIKHFQMEHFSGVKFVMGYEKNMTFLLQKFEKKS